MRRPLSGRSFCVDPPLTLQDPRLASRNLPHPSITKPAQKAPQHAHHRLLSSSSPVHLQYFCERDASRVSGKRSSGRTLTCIEKKQGSGVAQSQHCLIPALQHGFKAGGAARVAITTARAEKSRNVSTTHALVDSTEMFVMLLCWRSS